MEGIHLQKQVNFVDKDPIIDEIRTIVQDSGSTYKQIHEDSGVSANTLSAWFSGDTRKPQAATINAVLRALGYKLGGIVRYEVVPLGSNPRQRSSLEQACGPYWWTGEDPGDLR